MVIEIKNRYTGKVIIAGKYESIKDCLEENRSADLGGADLGGAYLGGAYLGGADLRGADLGDAYLGDAYLGGADLRGTDLRGAYLGGTDLRGADLRGTDLRGADLRGAYLGDADLGDAYLRGADLRGTDLRGAKKYYMSHDFCIEIIKRQPIKTFTDKEWSVIGQISVHKFCWKTIQKEYAKNVLSIFKKLDKLGYGEYLKKFKGEL